MWEAAAGMTEREAFPVAVVPLPHASASPKCTSTWDTSMSQRFRCKRPTRQTSGKELYKMKNDGMDNNVDVARQTMRESIILTVEKLIRSHGYLKVTVMDVARALDMSPANIYRFFKSKVELRRAFVECLFLRSEKICLNSIRENSEASDQMRQLIIQYHKIAVDRFLDDPNVHELVTIASSKNGAAIDNHISRMKKIIGDIIRNGVRSGEFKVRYISSAIDVVYAAMFTVVDPVCVSRSISDERDTQQVHAQCQFIINALKSNCI